MLKTGEYFSSWNRLHISLDCSFCSGQLEALEHLFLECTFAKEVRLSATPLFCKLLGRPSFTVAPQTLLGLDFVEGFPMVTQRLAFYFLNLILYAIWDFRKMKCFEKVDCMPRSATALVEHNFRQTCSKKFELWRGRLKLDKFRKCWAIGGAFCRVDCLDRLVYQFS